MSPRALLTLLVVLAAALGPATVAQGAWRPTTVSGQSAARATAMPTGPQPTVTVTARTATVSWSAPAGTPAPTGYTVERTPSGGSATAAGGTCAGTVTTLTCTDAALATGSYTYRVRAVRALWTGAAGTASSAATVDAPSLSLGTTSFSQSGGSSTATLASFTAADQVTFRLDSTSGTVLTTSPATVTTTAAGAASSVTLTIPAALSAGAHTVYAVGAAGTQATASITVAAPTPTFSIGTSTFASLPGSTTTAAVTNFKASESIAFRLDSASGTVLTTSPASVTASASGAASAVTITIPAGITTGAHTVYAVGGAGSQATASITVSGAGSSPTAMTLSNSTGSSRLLDAGDRIVITFSNELRPSSICSSWGTTSAAKSATGSVRLYTPNGGSNTVDITAMTGCTTFAFGSINLGRTNLTTTSSTVATWASSTIAWSNTGKTLTITLGGTPSVTGGSVQRIASGNNAVATYTPDAALWALSGADVTGTFATSALVPF